MQTPVSYTQSSGNRSTTKLNICSTNSRQSLLSRCRHDRPVIWSTLTNKIRRVLWTRKTPACFLTLLYASGKPRLPPVHKYSSLRSTAHSAAGKIWGSEPQFAVMPPVSVVGRRQCQRRHPASWQSWFDLELLNCGATALIGWDGVCVCARARVWEELVAPGH